MKKIVRKIKVGSHQLTFELTNRYAEAIIAGDRYNRLDAVVKHVTELSDPAYLESFAIVANLMFNGIQFKLKKGMGYKLVLEEGQLRFYVREVTSNDLYQVVCPFPYIDSMASFAYIPISY